MKKYIFIIFGIFSVFMGYLAGHAQTNQETHALVSFDRIMQKREIRCGYVIYPPYLNKDVATGRLNGPMKSIWDAIGKRLELKIIWTEEATWGTMIEGLRARRYDAVCSPVWANALRSQFVAFSAPLGYERIAAWTRADEKRFDNDLSSINDPDVRISVIDGEMAMMLADRLFPKARQNALPQNASFADMMMNVTNGKADIALKETVVGRDFLKHNPGSIKITPGGEAVQWFPVTVLLPLTDVAFKNMIDQTIGELQRDGTIQTIMNDAALSDAWRATPD